MRFGNEREISFRRKMRDGDKGWMDVQFWFKAVDEAMAQKEYQQLGCLEVDPTCGYTFEVCAETEEEVLRLASEHGKIAHQMSDLPLDMAAKVKSAIKSVTVNV